MAATYTFAPTKEPRNIVSAGVVRTGDPLASGSYLVQNTASAYGAHVLFRAQEDGSTAPASTAPAIRVEPGEKIELSVDGDPIYCWSPSDAARIVVMGP